MGGSRGDERLGKYASAFVRAARPFIFFGGLSVNVSTGELKVSSNALLTFFRVGPHFDSRSLVSYAGSFFNRILAEL